MSNNLSAQLDRIAKRFHRHGQVGQTRDVVKVGDRSQCDDKMIVVQLLRMIAVTARNQDLLILQVDLVYVPNQYFNFAKEFPEGIHDIRDLKIARRDLMKHRREQKEILAADEGDFYRTVSRH